MSSDTEPEHLLERGSELGAIERAVRAVLGGSGRFLVVEGPAGVGKTALLSAGADLAEQSGMQVMRARGAELEVDFGFALAAQLFEHEIRECPELLADQAAPAAAALGIRRAATSSAEALHGVLQGLYRLTAELAERTPVTLVVDDAHWADPASLRFLSYLAHRIEGLRVLVLAAIRPAASAGASIKSIPTAQVLEAKPLSPQGTRRLVRSLVPSLPDETAMACHAATGGNAFYVHAVVRSLQQDPEVALGASDWSPAAITRSVGARLEMLSADARRLAQAVSILGPEAPLRHAAQIAQLDMTAASAALDDLSASDILARRRELQFVHPIVRSAVRDDLGPGARARLHRKAAQLLAAEDASAEHVAVHLLHCEPAADQWTVSVLREAGSQALGRGAPETGLKYLLRGLDEPAAADQQVALLVDLAEAEALMFDPVAATAHLHEAYAKAADRDERLGIASGLAALLAHVAATASGIDLLARVRDEFADAPEQVLRIEARMANVGRGDLSGRRASLPVAARLREAAGNPAAGPEVLAASAAELAMVSAPAARVRELARSALVSDAPLDEPGAAFTRMVAARVLIVAEDFETAESALRHAGHASRSQGSMLGAAFASVFLAELLLRRGDLAGAQTEASDAYELAKRGWPGGMSWLVASLLQVFVEQGKLGAADELLSEADLVAPACELSDAYTSNLLLAARGRLRLVQDRPGEALRDLRECGRRQLEWHELNPALVPWRSLAAAAAADLGELEEARGLAFEELELARRFGAPGAIGIALRAAARVSDDDEGERLAGAACEVLASSEARLQHAYALADLAQRKLAHGRREEARALLEPALELTDHCGAAALESLVRRQLRSAGGRPRRAQRSGPLSLTPSELQVATLAAEGQPNREIASTLFVTERTVEFHLGHAYRKLGISSRRQLPEALAGSPRG